jgi:hypothetical protein
MITKTEHRHLVMQAVERGEVVATWRRGKAAVDFRRRLDTYPFDLEMHAKLPAAGSRAVREMWFAGLLRLSRAGQNHGDRHTRTVLSTAQGRRWAAAPTLKARRGTSNGNSRGGSDDRARRRQYLVDTFGDGIVVDCALALPGCAGYLTVDTVTVDRIVPGCEGGTYRRSNIRPACASCNSKHGAQLGNQRKGTES